ncbi:hypothetical protein, partial [Caballeronia sp.]|uniref:hypothetical protein n=1 Tax=Caballeronia sp. TaxID=1931223 RepID=UPI003C4C430B
LGQHLEAKSGEASMAGSDSPMPAKFLAKFATNGLSQQRPRPASVLGHGTSKQADDAVCDTSCDSRDP